MGASSTISTTARTPIVEMEAAGRKRCKEGNPTVGIIADDNDANGFEGINFSSDGDDAEVR
jgi:hypothetical protein